MPHAVLHALPLLGGGLLGQRGRAARTHGLYQLSHANPEHQRMGFVLVAGRLRAVNASLQPSAQTQSSPESR